jgi:hypothetical protein
MDIEAHEYWALPGVFETTKTHWSVMIIEYNVRRLKFLNVSNSDMKRT